MTNQILIIDNDDEMFGHLAAVLNELGMVYTRKKDAEDIEKLIVVTNFNAVLINLATLSDIDRIVNVKKLALYTSEVIVMGTEQQGDMILEAMERGIDDYVRLPVKDRMFYIRLMTILKHSRQKIEKNAKYLDDMFMNCLSPEVVLDEKGRIITVNETALKRFSKTRENSIGELLGGFLNCAKRKHNQGYGIEGCGGCALYSYIEDVFYRDKTTVGKEFSYKAASGAETEERTLKLNVLPVYYAGRKCVFINFEDVTVRKKSEEILTSCLEKIRNGKFDCEDAKKKIDNFAESVSEVSDKLKMVTAEYNTLLTNIHSGYLLLEKNTFDDLIVKDVNGRLCEIFAIKREDVIGHSFSERLITFNPKLQQVVKDVLETGKRSHTEYQSEIFGKKWLKINAFMVNPRTIALIIGDNTVSRLSNEKLKDMLKKVDERNFQFELFMQGSNDGAWSYNYITKEIYISTQFKRQLGYGANELKMISPYEIFNLIAPEDRDAFIKKIEAVNAGELFKLESEVRLLKKDGKEKWFLIRAAVKSDVVEGTPELLGGVITDISQRKEAEMALEVSNEKLQSAVETKNKFMSIISHDLRNQFNAINGLSEILAKKLKNSQDDRSAQIATVINQSSQSAYKLLNDLLVWARSQMDGIKFEPEYFDVHTATDEAFNEIRIQAQKKHINLQNLTTDKEKVFADRQMYLTVIRNIASNAIKFTKDDGEVSVLSHETEKETVITIRDNGVGMTESQVQKLMTDDGNKSTVGTSGEKGSGIGLMLCREFVLKHNGKIEVKSQIGKGTDFIITFPKSKNH
jgi:PAS domain S-box-containing protein